MGFLMWGLITIAVLVAIIHFWTTDRYTDGMGAPSRDYRKFLGRKQVKARGLEDIPPPPNGVRDEEVEGLLRSGDFDGARQLLVIRMEEARLAPVGRETQIARVSHYLNLLGGS